MVTGVVTTNKGQGEPDSTWCLLVAHYCISKFLVIDQRFSFSVLLMCLHKNTRLSVNEQYHESFIASWKNSWAENFTNNWKWNNILQLQLLQNKIMYCKPMNLVLTCQYLSVAAAPTLRGLCYFQKYFEYIIIQ